MTEVIDLENPDNNCEDYFPYPISTGNSDSVGGLLENSFPIICGGYSDSFSKDECFILGYDTVQAKMSIERSFAASLVVNNSLWILGGQSEGIRINSTEFITLDSDPVKGPDMPEALIYHCVLKVNDTTVFLSGGYTTSRKTYFYNMGDAVWSEGPDMKIPRYGHGCGLVKDRTTSTLFIVVAGGYNSGYLDTTELLPLNHGELNWIYGPKLPIKARYMASISLPDQEGVLLVGGYQSDTIRQNGPHSGLYIITCDDGACKVEKM